MSGEVKDKVIRILAEQAVLDPAEIRLDSTLGDIGLDSLGLVETMFAIEETFDVQVPYNANAPQDSAFDISTVGSLVAGVERLVSERP